jgi:CRISPR-associated endonuclease Cas2
MQAALVIYDISDDKVRLRIANRLLKDGNRVQESAFEVFFKTPSARDNLERDLHRLLRKGSGQIRWYGINQDSLAQSGAIGSAKPEMPPSVQIL